MFVYCFFIWRDRALRRKGFNKLVLKSAIRLLAGAASALVLTAVCVSAVFAEDVRIGIKKYFDGVDSIAIADSTINVSIGSGQIYYVSSNGGFSVRPISTQFFLTEKFYTTFEEAAEAATAYTDAKLAIPVLKEQGWALYIQSDKALENAARVDTGSQAVVFVSGGDMLFAVDGNTAARAVSGSGVLNMGSVKYRGAIEFNVQDKKLMGINVVDMEEYLYGVVPSEMSGSWNIEALKAQAIAARTYAAANKGKHGIYDLCDTVDCQDYNGTSKEMENATKAVKETAGQKMYYNNTLINAYYFSSSGGKTASSENTWSEAVPYLRGVDDPYDKEGMVWKRTYTYEQLSAICRGKGFNIGTVKSVALDFDTDGIASRLTFVGTDGTDYVSKDGIRSFFSAGEGGSLPSRNFKLDSGTAIPQDITVLGGDAEKSTITFNSVSVYDGSNTITKLNNSAVAAGDKEKAEIKPVESSVPQGSVVFDGRGFGHLVGMSQYGAKGMADEGKKYDEILKHYYTGIEIK